MKTLMKTLMATAMAVGLAGAVAAEDGVTADEIKIGSVNDLSGIFAAVGVPAVAGAQMRIDEQNAAGGVHGRKITFIVEDNGYQMPRAMQGYNKLINSDNVFAMLLSLGTPMNIAGFKLLDPKNIPNISPLSAAREMLSDPIHNKFTGFSSYYDQVQAGVTFLAKDKGATNICSMYIPSDFGKEIAQSSKDIAATLGLKFADETTHKPDELDFVGSLQKLKASGCQIVTLAVGVRQGITIVGTAKKMGLSDMTFMNTSAGFLEPVAMVPGGVTDGLYASAGWQDLYSRAAEAVPGKFIADFKAKTGENASMFAMLGYSGADAMIRALEAAGPDLTRDSFIAAFEGLKYHDDLTGADVDYADHQGASEVVISVVENGGWKMIGKQ
jgi:branched-chain amino acid transport system substrate-binding protein